MAAREQQFDPLMVSSQDFLPWDEKEPQNVAGRDDCGLIIPWKFHDCHCTVTFPYICNHLDVKLVCLQVGDAAPGSLSMRTATSSTTGE